MMCKINAKVDESHLKEYRSFTDVDGANQTVFLAHSVSFSQKDLFIPEKMSFKRGLTIPIHDLMPSTIVHSKLLKMLTRQ